MKPRSVLLTTLLVGLATAPTVEAAQNTVSGNYRVDAVMTEGGALLQGPAEVYVLDAGGEVVARRHAVPAVFDLGTGDFTAAVVYGHAQARGAIELGTKPGNNPLNLEAGEVRLDLITRDGKRARLSDVSWRVYRYRRTEDLGTEVAESQVKRPEFILDAGWYEVVVRQAGASDSPPTARHVIEVESGRRQTYNIEVD
ncbi:hypothetical protein CKO28_22660 [Rhodovibrio sodomensis]|uniref:Uncharacterized protein n=1 Tax=Rhodovibrio sodomensis TaxID=1088 RepID=A0ABS1DM68_9PROT|nr:hypothetical protein [Rhodovibrio sodomensis]MBK1670823.1 hypothetical protein [Rhodovibrio sodomensis]